MTNLQQQYYWQQQRRRQLLNYRHFIDMQIAQGAGAAEDQKEPVYPNDKLRIVVQTTCDSQLMSNRLFAVGEEPGYTKTGIYSAQRDNESKPITIDWGDGTVEEVDGDVSEKTHEYAKTGKYMVVVENIKTFAASAVNNTWYRTTSQNAYTLKKVVSMSETVTSIGNYAFFSCSSFVSIQLPASLTRIGGGAFQNCTSLSNVQLPASLTSISGSAFRNCSSLSNITCGAMTAPTVQSSTFGDSIDSYTGINTNDQGINRLYVPTGATGYDSSYWADPFQNASKCGFTIEYI